MAPSSSVVKVPPADLKFDCAFRWFYDRHYSNGKDLPKYVDRVLFREHMLEQFMAVYQDAIANGQPEQMGPGLLHPLMSEWIDPGAGGKYDMYWNDEYQVEVPALVLSLQKEWHDLVWSGDKTGELRKGAVGQYDDLEGELIVLALNGDKTGEHSIMVRVESVEYASSLDEQCDSGNWPAITPQVTAKDEAQGAQEAKDLLLSIRKQDGTQVFSPEAVKEKGGLCAIYFEPEFGCEKSVC